MDVGNPLNPGTVRLIMKELYQLQREKLEGITIRANEENVAVLDAEITGPEHTPYEGGTFLVRLVLDGDFPNSPPKGFFITKLFHPNVSNKGEICVNTLKKDWNSGCGLKRIFMVIRCLLIEPNPESALNEEAGKLLLENYDEYFKRAKLYTSVHAMKEHAKENIPDSEAGMMGGSSTGSNLASAAGITSLRPITSNAKDNSQTTNTSGITSPKKKLEKKRSLKRL
eukprot:TRINITY_DN67796_c4_g13_i1.p1 TRINITY_DN67796_c4_g13~~TRINITY_DN67796_c4_g13_i1.p1  ORF type:complete len:226 (+),score=36.68 TRINITY_DN67796_c4_g13_i1:47-724(+)